MNNCFITDSNLFRKERMSEYILQDYCFIHSLIDVNFNKDNKNFFNMIRTLNLLLVLGFACFRIDNVICKLMQQNVLLF